MSEPPAGTLRLAASLDGPAGAPVLVLGNSLGTSRAVWDRQAADLARHFRLLRYELPGHGGSPAAPGALLDRRARRRGARSARRARGGPGRLLRDLARRNDRHVAGRHHAGPDHRARPGLHLRVPAARVGLAGPRRPGTRRRDGLGHRAVARPVVPAGFAEREPQAAAAFAADLERTDVDGYAGCCAAIAGMDLRGELGSIAAPTLVIAGADDPATPPDHGAAICGGDRRLAAGGGARGGAPGECLLARRGRLSTARPPAPGRDVAARRLMRAGLASGQPWASLG